MSAPQVMYAVGGTLIGGAVGFLLGRASIEAQVRTEYEESTKAYRRAMEIRRINELAETVQPPAATEEELITIESKQVVEGSVINITPEGGLNMITKDETPKDHLVPIRPEDHKENPYHVALTAEETTIDAFVDGVANAEGIAYIEEDEFLQNEDERFKGQIIISLDENNIPEFFMGGVLIHDWAQRVGSSILVDMFQRVPQGIDPVLYVRNHRTDEDYEVIREVP